MIWLGLALAAAAVALAYFLGRSGAQKRQAQANAAVKDEQLKVAADRPTDKRDLARRVRDDF